VVVLALACIGAPLAASAPEPGPGAPTAPGADAARVGPRTTPIDLAAYRQVRYVSMTGTAGGDGSRARPWAALDQALARLVDTGADRRVAVLVAAGTYPTRALRLKSFVDFYGGFAPATWERDLVRYRTTLDAEGKDRLLLGADAARVDGFTLRGGRARGHGGAVLCDRAAPVITNNTFTDNATLESPGYVRGVLHQVGSEGGAIACMRYASPRIEQNLFLGNWTEIGGGGAIAMRSDSVRPQEEIPGPVVRNNVFLGCRTGAADTDPDVKKRWRSSNGGALSLSNSLAEITGNLFLDNRAGGNGDGGAIYCEYEASPRIAHNHFIANRAEDDGGAIYSMKLSEPRIEANLFSGNLGGGSIRLSKQGRARIAGNLIFANPAGGIASGDSWAMVEENVIMDNGGTGLSHGIQTATYLKPSLLRGNVLRGNQAGQLQVQAAELAVVAENNVQGGYAGTGNRDADPRRDTRRQTWPVARIAYDPTAGQSRLVVDGLALAPLPGPGRIARLGDRWGVVDSVAAGELVAWGDLRAADAATLELLGTYLPLTPAP
jgi:predicted outer membrane repeat protein